MKLCAICGGRFYLGKKHCPHCRNTGRRYEKKSYRGKRSKWAKLYDKRTFSTWGEKARYYKKIRPAIVERDGECLKCEAKEKLHVHHIVDIEDGGTHDLDNLVTLCCKCHLKEHREMRNAKEN